MKQETDVIKSARPLKVELRSLIRRAAQATGVAVLHRENGQLRIDAFGPQA